MAKRENGLSEAFDDLRLGKITRRDFLARAAALGIGAPLALMLVNSAGVDGVSAQDGSSGRQSAGTDGQTRGAGGELRVRQWLAADSAWGPYADSTGSTSGMLSSAEMSSLILEPLLSYAPDGLLLPTLVTEVPTKGNGGLSDDLKTVTFNLREGVLWSDGEPLTADDVVWTWQWHLDESNGSVYFGDWGLIQAAEAVNPTRVELFYASPSLAWFVPLTGAYAGSILPSHIWADKDKDTVNAEFALEPIGTGPYKIDQFVPGSHAMFEINDGYREPHKPYFSTVRFQGGGDSFVTAQAVLQTGDWDAATFMLLQPDVLRELESAGGKGKLVAGLATGVERIVFNFSDPNREIDGERSSLQAPHPFLTDRDVRQAMTLAIDRNAIANEVFLGDEITPAARNILTGIPELESPNTSLEFDIDAANDLLDQAGWVWEGDVRIKNGIELAVTFDTATLNVVFKRWRAETQAVVEKAWEAIGVRVRVGQLPGDVFFDSPDNERSYVRFQRDVQMFSSGLGVPFPYLYFEEWYAGPGNSNVAQRSNDWNGWNLQRYVNPEFDALYEEVSTTIDPGRAAELFIQMNDLIVGDFVVVPLYAWSNEFHAISNRLAADNVAINNWEPLFWNIANWRTVEE